MVAGGGEEGVAALVGGLETGFEVGGDGGGGCGGGVGVEGIVVRLGSVGVVGGGLDVFFFRG